MNRILIVDDHVQFRAALREFLSQDPDFEIVGEAGSAGEAMRSVATLSPHLVLTDLTIPGARGIDAVTEIKRHYPNVKIIVVSFHSEDEYRHTCCEAGAAGYIVKDAIHEELCDGIRAALGGKSYRVTDAPNAESVRLLPRQRLCPANGFLRQEATASGHRFQTP